MNNKRPFQFGIKHLLGLTFFFAVLAWFASLEESWGMIAIAAYLAIGVGQILTALVVMARPTPARALSLAYVNFILTMPTYVMLIYSMISLEDALTRNAWVLLVLHVVAVITNGISWIIYVRPLRDRWLTVLWLLNLLNSVFVFGAVIAERILFPMSA